MTPQEKLGKAAYAAFFATVSNRFDDWDTLLEAHRQSWIAAAEAAVEADAMARINMLLCAEHFNQAERNEVPKLEKCIVCIRNDMRAHLKTILSKDVQIQGLMHDLNQMREKRP